MKNSPIVSFLVMISLLIFGCIPDNDSIPSPAEEALPAASTLPELPQASTASKMTTAPDFSLPTLSGDSLHLADLKGKVLVLNFWATWCGPCRYEIPDLIALQNDLGSDDFLVVGISLDDEGPELVREFAEALEINYPIALDDGSVAEAFGGVYALPTTYVIDQAGRISHRTIGLFPTETFKSDLLTMLGSD